MKNVLWSLCRPSLPLYAASFDRVLEWFQVYQPSVQTCLRSRLRLFSLGAWGCKDGRLRRDDTKLKKVLWKNASSPRRHWFSLTLYLSLTHTLSLSHTHSLSHTLTVAAGRKKVEEGVVEERLDPPQVCGILGDVGLVSLVSVSVSVSVSPVSISVSPISEKRVVEERLDPAQDCGIVIGRLGDVGLVSLVSISVSEEVPSRRRQERRRGDSAGEGGDVQSARGLGEMKVAGSSSRRR